EINPPISPDEPDGSSPPAGAEPGVSPKAGKSRGTRGTRIAPDWQPCPTSELTERTQRIVAGWPAGAYEHVGEMFRHHWLAESRAQGSKRDWQATWDNWLRRENPSVLRQMQQGIRFDLPTTIVVASKSPAELQADAAGVEAVAEIREAEGDRAARMRVILRSGMGPRLYDEWLKGVALRLEGETLVVVAPSEFARGWIEQHHTARVAEAAAEVLGRPVKIVVRLVRPPG
ncbi:hypothetical protein OMP43_22825, partial [Sphingomonas sp. CBMAI 2297]|uniref:DnaA N-terminal domain-containing protein n=1 Tax=Sphingomonas sp. CBMAI 2297 TaxID=2991720 RepID=UPI0024566722